MEAPGSFVRSNDTTPEIRTLDSLVTPLVSGNKCLLQLYQNARRNAYHTMGKLGDIQTPQASVAEDMCHAETLIAELLQVDRLYSTLIADSQRLVKSCMAVSGAELLKLFSEPDAESQFVSSAAVLQVYMSTPKQNSTVDVVNKALVTLTNLLAELGRRCGACLDRTVRDFVPTPAWAYIFAAPPVANPQWIPLSEWNGMTATVHESIVRGAPTTNLSLIDKSVIELCEHPDLVALGNLLRVVELARNVATRVDLPPAIALGAYMLMPATTPLHSEQVGRVLSKTIDSHRYPAARLMLALFLTHAPGGPAFGFVKESVDLMFQQSMPMMWVEVTEEFHPYFLIATSMHVFDWLLRQPRHRVIARRPETVEMFGNLRMRDMTGVSPDLCALLNCWAICTRAAVIIGGPVTARQLSALMTSDIKACTIEGGGLLSSGAWHWRE